MGISTAEVKKTAWLARLGFEETEIGKLQENLSAILDYFKILNEVETSGIEPERMKPGAPLRDDDPCESLPRAEALKNAPAIKDGMFKVPKVI